VDVITTPTAAAVPEPHEAKAPERERYLCPTCLYGATAVHPPARCPMCGSRAWLLDPRPRRDDP
jgi:hypothetical protein